ncbi:MAG: glycerophosphodiester phosphodiesterase, partial [Alphaproteobacteria bacterium]|nr:glycerophosphodiester phosphodiesterase [Alphaproteobacteria bacterium]
MTTLNFAHRGGAALYPENTLAAFRDAVARGCDGAELDVQLSKDGEVVVFHDYRLKPEIVRKDGKWIEKPTPRIKDLTLADLQAYDIGRLDPASPYGKAHPHNMPVDGERIPTLAQVLEVTSQAKKPFVLQVELKTSFMNREESSLPEELTEAAVAVLRKANYLDRTIFVGFDWAGLIHAKKIAPGVRCWFTTMELDFLGPPKKNERPQVQLFRHMNETGTSPWAAGFDPSKYRNSIARAVKAAGGDGWFPYFPDATPERVAEAKSLGLKTGAWTVNEPADMRRLIGLGLDGLCTDRP